MNELDVVVTLRLHQMKHIVDAALPSNLSECLTFEAPALVGLRRRIRELEEERIAQKRQHQSGGLFLYALVLRYSLLPETP